MRGVYVGGNERV